MIESREQVVARLGLRPLTQAQLAIVKTARMLIDTFAKWYICPALDEAAFIEISVSEHAAREAAFIEISVSEHAAREAAAREAATLKDLVDMRLSSGYGMYTLATWAAQEFANATGVRFANAHRKHRMFEREMRLAWLDRIIELEAM